MWEIDGAGHREILGNPAFLRELRAEMRNLFTGKTSSDKTSRPPVVDSDCYWNYRRAKCEFPEFCEYRYSFGDVILDQSCRLRLRRKRPAPARPPLVERSTDGGPVLLTTPALDYTRPFCSAPCHAMTAQPCASSTAVCAPAK